MVSRVPRVSAAIRRARSVRSWTNRSTSRLIEAATELHREPLIGRATLMRRLDPTRHLRDRPVALQLRRQGQAWGGETEHLFYTVRTDRQGIEERSMSGYVTFKLDRGKGNEYALRAAEATSNLQAAGDVFAAWPVSFGPGGGQPPAPSAEVYFRIGTRYPGTNIWQLNPISSDEYDRLRATKPVARFSPYKDFQHAAQVAGSLS